MVRLGSIKQHDTNLSHEAITHTRRRTHGDDKAGVNHEGLKCMVGVWWLVFKPMVFNF